MSKDYNKVVLTGRLGKDVKLTNTGSTTVATFSVASNRPVKDGDNWKDETEWFNVVAWRELAERAAQRFQKGSKVLVEGRLQTRQYKDQSGQDRRITEVVASDIIGLETSRSASAAAGENDDEQDVWGDSSEEAPF